MAFAASKSRFALQRGLKLPLYPASNVRAASTVVVTPATPKGATNNLRTILSLTALVAGTTLFTVYYLDSRSAIHRYAFMPLVRLTMDPETGHRFAVKVLGSGLGPRDIGRDDGSLRVELWGSQIASPVGLAAGFDKDGEAIQGLFNLGFSWVEIGSVTPKPNEGNPKPRVFHLPEDSALINRYGFPSQGHAVLLSRLRSHLASNPPSAASSTVLAVNLGKNKSSAPDSTSDFIAGVEKFGDLVDVLVINVSSPNTPGLRGMQGRGVLEELLSEVVKARDTLPARSQAEWKWEKAKIVVKIAPDLSEHEIKDIAEASPSTYDSVNAIEKGGLSGPPLKALSIKALRTLRSHLPVATPIIGCGGITAGSDAIEFAENGATLVQIYTSFSYDGPGCPRRVKDEITSQLHKGNTSWNELVAKSVPALSLKEKVPVSPEQLLKDQAQEIKATLESVGKNASTGLKEKVDRGREILEGQQKSLHDLILEAEAALGISKTPPQ
ncbi:Dihydroorotate dehydrogenase (quinone), mitochondrial [Tulasnella sp. 330]|nr:Dihydroorotate dehydrogenase (quinone), mitochondrial [Tulasnella sp. 330]KAG8880912.1 Dihydroorotate dehydrogenase (quinone), mitochondrial [Tulasnella sp. 331]